MKNALISSLTAIAFSASAVSIVENGKPVAVIYVNEFDPHAVIDQVKNIKKNENLPAEEIGMKLFSIAVKDFNYHIKRLCGEELPIKVVKSPDEIKEPAIVLGSLAVKADKDFKVTSDSMEAFRIKSKDGRVLAGSANHFGSSMAVYELLKLLGFDWVFPGTLGEIIPEKKNLTLENMDSEGSPSFMIRAPWFAAQRVAKEYGEDFDHWVLRQKGQINDNPDIYHPLKMRGGHVWQDIVRRYKDRFEKDPTMYALMKNADGTTERKGPQIETTHPGVIDLMVDYIRSEFKKNKWPNDKKVCIGIGPADSSRFSSSPETQLILSGRTDPLSGLPNVSDLLVHFANQLLEKTTDEFPNLYLGFYLYSTHTDYPQNVKPHPRLSITIADISFSRLHGIHDGNSKTRNYYKHILEQWKKLYEEQKNVYFFRGFDYNLAECFLPYTKLKVWGEDIPYYHRMGIQGMYNNWSATWSISAPSNYLDINMEWDVTLDWKKVLADYCRKAFGAGAEPMERYYRSLAQRQGEAGYETGSFYSFPLIYDEKFISDSEALFDQAERKAKRPEEKERIRRFRVPLEMLKLFLAFHRDVRAFRFADAEKKFDTLSEMLLKNATDHPLFFEKPRYLERFLRNMVVCGRTYSSAPYCIALPMPEKLKMGLDPKNNGVLLGFYRTEINDTQWPEYSTYSSSWDAQGLYGVRSGSAWYRWHFKAPELKKGEFPGLMLSGVDNIADVWCNNQYLGRGMGFVVPFAFDLSKAFKQGENTLVIRVERFGNSETGSGGIMFPGYIFAGPKLETPAPIESTLEEILPGAGGIPEYKKKRAKK